MTALADRSAYCALRFRPDADAQAWWLAVRERRDVPEVISVLVAGRARVEVSRDEAVRALEWASHVDGWAEAETKPLCLYPSHD